MGRISEVHSPVARMIIFFVFAKFKWHLVFGTLKKTRSNKFVEMRLTSFAGVRLTGS